MTAGHSAGGVRSLGWLVRGPSDSPPPAFLLSFSARNTPLRVSYCRSCNYYLIFKALFKSQDLT